MKAHPGAPAGEPVPAQAGAAAVRRTLTRRVLLLLACLAAGLAIGLVGQGVSGRSAWFLAIPACIAIGWLFVADPAECVTPARKP